MNTAQCVAGREVCEVCVWSDTNAALCVTGREVCEVRVWSDTNAAPLPFPAGLAGPC